MPLGADETLRNCQSVCYRLLLGLTVTFLGGLLLVSTYWAAAAIHRGFDLSDESLYVVSYRYYRDPELVHTGAAAVLGPIFDLVGWSIPGLRLIKLAILLAGGAALGRAVSTWFRDQPMINATTTAITSPSVGT